MPSKVKQDLPDVSLEQQCEKLIDILDSFFALSKFPWEVAIAAMLELVLMGLHARGVPFKFVKDVLERALTCYAENTCKPKTPKAKPKKKKAKK